FWEFTDTSWNNWQKNKPATPNVGAKNPDAVRYWLYAPGTGGEHWDEFHSQGIMAIGWDFLGDLSRYQSKEDIAQAMRKHDNEPDRPKKNHAARRRAFRHEMKPGDIIFAKI